MAEILVEVDIYSRSRDADGVVYDVLLNWVDDTLPIGAVDPDGAMLAVEGQRKWTDEQLRDEIRDRAIIALETSVLGGGYGFPPGQLTRGNIRVEGHSNAGDDAAFSPNAPFSWFSGEPFYPVFGGNLDVVRPITKVGIEILFDGSLPATQRVTQATFTLSFGYGALPVLSTQLEYWVYAYDARNEAAGPIWTLAIPSALVNTNQLEVSADLTAVAQDILWSTQTILFQLAIKRLAGSGTTINANKSGKLRRAQVALTR